MLNPQPAGAAPADPRVADRRRRILARLRRLDDRRRQRKRRRSLGVAVALARPHHEPPRSPRRTACSPCWSAAARRREVVDRRRVVRRLQHAFDPHAEPQTLRRLAASPDLRFVVSNTTEAGIVDTAEPYDPGGLPLNFPAKIAWVLKARFDALGGVAAPGLVVAALRIDRRPTARRFAASTLAAAQRWNFAPEFADWIGIAARSSTPSWTASCRDFPPPRPSACLKPGAIATRSPSLAEPYHLWVIEGDLAANGRWPRPASMSSGRTTSDPTATPKCGC